jgi:hypothetical protein
MIGAEPSDLAAAAFLAQAGARVVVCEQAGRIEVCFAATQRTKASLTANTQGAIMGWSYRRRRGPPRGDFLQMRHSVLTPVPRLLIAGHWSFSPGGSPVAVLTGKLAAEHVLKNDTER